MKKYWWIGIALIFTVITLAVSGVLLKQKGEEENKANDVVKIDEDIIQNSSYHHETRVLMGEKIGVRYNKEENL